MIRQNKHDGAHAALNAILVHLRFIAASHAPYDELVAVLDVAEHLPMLFLRSEDMTDYFRGVLVELAAKHPDLQSALYRFDGE